MLALLECLQVSQLICDCLTCGPACTVLSVYKVSHMTCLPCSALVFTGVTSGPATALHVDPVTCFAFALF
jgi:hypothetical protein